MSNADSSAPTRRLPDHPSMEQLKKQAKELLKSIRAGEGDALKEVYTFEREPDFERFRLIDAQRVLSRAYGFLSWRQLKCYVDSLDIAEFCNAVTRRDLDRVRQLAEIRPELVDIDRGDEQIALHISIFARDEDMTRLLMELGSDARRGFWPHREATSAYAIARERGYDEILSIIEAAESKRVAKPSTNNAKKIVRESSEHETNQTESKAAVIAGDLAKVSELFLDGRLANPVDFYAGGLLSIAVRDGNFDMLKLLTECGLDINERATKPVGNGFQHSWGMPLYYASSHGRHEMAKWLIAHGSDVNAVVHACGDAISNADDAMKQLLLDAGARVTVEHVASWQDIELASAIIDGTAPAQSLNSASAQSGDGQADPEIITWLLWAAAFSGAPKIVERCLEAITWPIDEARWHYILMQPLRFGNLAFEKRDDDVNARFYECFRRLLDHEVDPDVKMNGNTVLHHLAASGEPTEGERLEFARLLLDAGASLSLRDTGTLMSTPLGWACRWGRIELVRYYLDRGARIDEPDAESWATPMARAESNGHQAIVEFLKNSSKG